MRNEQPRPPKEKSKAKKSPKEVDPDSSLKEEESRLRENPMGVKADSNPSTPITNMDEQKRVTNVSPGQEMNEQEIEGM